MTRKFLSLTSLACLATAASCSAGSGEIELVFPSEEARDATEQIQVLAINRNMVGVGVIEVNCEALLSKFRTGAPPAGGEPVDIPLTPPFDGKQLPNFPTGEPVVFVVAYNTSGENQRPLLAGCSEEFDSGGNADIVIEMEVVIPEDTRLVKTRGDFQVTTTGGQLPEELCVKVDATLPGERDVRYALPGITVDFTPDDEASLNDASPGASVAAVTDAEGLACVAATLPDVVGPYDASALAPELFADDEDKEERSRGDFTLTTIGSLEMQQPTTIVPNLGGSTVIDVEAGDVDGDGAGDIVILACAGPAESCVPGPGELATVGSGEVLVISDALGTRNETTLTDVGLLPGGIVVGQILPGAPDEIAVVNGRRMDCGARAAPCENSEVRLLSVSNGAINLEERITLTSSNAVDIKGFKEEPGSDYLSLVIAAQGRTKNDFPCNQAACLAYDPNCTDPTQCGCPPGERCECPPGENCTDGNEIGVCVARDKELEVIHNRLEAPEPLAAGAGGSLAAANNGIQAMTASGVVAELRPLIEIGFRPQTVSLDLSAAAQSANQGVFRVTRILDRGRSQGQNNSELQNIEVWFENPGGVPETGVDWTADILFENNEGCQDPELLCGKKGTGRPDPNECGCRDNGAQQCGDRDNCGCDVPTRITIGNQGSAQPPHAVGAGILRDPVETGVEFVVATAAGLDFIAKQNNPDTYKWATQPIVNAPIHELEIVDLNEDGAGDIVWFSRETCEDGQNTLARCPLILETTEQVTTEEETEEIELPPACFGVFVRYIDPDKRLSDVQLDAVESCRRYPTYDIPSDLCTGDVNGDGRMDVVLTTESRNVVSIYAGDGRGGVLFPPREIELPQAGGKVSCVDVDGNFRDDIVVTSMTSGEIHIVRSAL